MRKYQPSMKTRVGLKGNGTPTGETSRSLNGLWVLSRSRTASAICYNEGKAYRVETVVEKARIVEEIWVNVTEGTERTGYYRDHVQKLARDNWNLPEEERLIRVRKRSNGYDLWLPDLIAYIENHGLGPYKRKKSH